MESLKIRPCCTSAHLHLIGMFLMLCDHIWAASLLDFEFLTMIGRIAFPIFCFLIVEGFYHTRNVNKYLQRIFIGAVISEIPFNLVAGGHWTYLTHQNVLWTFFLGILMLKCLEKQKGKTLFKQVLFSFLIAALFLLLAIVCFVDYHAPGIATILVFYFLRGNTWRHRLGQLLGLYYINFEFLGGLVYPVVLGSWSFEFPLQGFALLSLIFIWLYNGKKGYDKPWFKTACYAFYPAHLLVLGALAFLL